MSREHKLERTNPIEALSDEQLVNMIEELTERIARRAAGSDAKLIEGGAVETTTVATTTPLVLDPPKRKRPNRLLEHVDTAVGPKERRTRKRKVPLAPRA